MRFLVLLFFLAGCPSDDHLESDLGGPCTHGHDCLAHGKERKCYKKKCVTAEEFERVSQRVALEQSGVEIPVEVLDEPIPEGFNVRVQRTKGEGRTLAACKPDEFLISGGCSNIAHSKGVVETRKGTTLGAYWLCAASPSEMRNYKAPAIEAFALCAKP